MMWLLQFVLVLALSAAASAQVSVGVDLPEGSSILLSPSGDVVFDLSTMPYPPSAFPADYAPTAPEGPLSIDVFSNVDGTWFLIAEFDGLLSEAGHLIPSEQLEYRLDGGAWFALTGEIVLASGSKPTDAYERYELELRLVLVGNERPGVYAGTLVLSIVKL